MEQKSKFFSRYLILKSICLFVYFLDKEIWRWRRSKIYRRSLQVQRFVTGVPWNSVTWPTVYFFPQEDDEVLKFLLKIWFFWKSAALSGGVPERRAARWHQERCEEWRTNPDYRSVFYLNRPRVIFTLILITFHSWVFKRSSDQGQTSGQVQNHLTLMKSSS